MSTSTTSNTPSDPSSSTNSSTDSAAPSMLHGHAQYIQGAVSSLIGLESGESTKSEAIKEMKEASSNEGTSEGPKTSNILGEAENVLGKIVGCEGMIDQGEDRKPAASSSSSVGASAGGEGGRLV